METQSEMMKEVAQHRAEVRGQAAAPVVEETPAEETAPAEGEAQAAAPVEETEVIRIGDREFKSQAEAIRYAEELERERLISEAYNTGVKETLNATQQKAEPPPEEDFNEKFFADPKKYIQEERTKATQEALAIVQAEQRKEALWGQFLNQYPDIERRDAERILNENLETIGAIKDVQKGMELLAKKTRDEYRRIADRFLPRKELPNKGGQVVSAGSAAPTSVTPQKKESGPLDLSAQLRSIRKR